MYTGTNLRLPLDFIRWCPPGREEYLNYGSYVQKLTVKKINDVVFCIQKIPKRKKKIIHIDQWRLTAIGNFFCSTHGYFEPWFSRETQGKCQSRDRDEVPRHANFPLVSKNYQHVGLVEKSDTSIFRWKSRHVDFSLEKATRRFFVGKADTSVFGPKSRRRF